MTLLLVEADKKMRELIGFNFLHEDNRLILIVRFQFESLTYNIFLYIKQGTFDDLNVINWSLTIKILH